jgi:hypothetical protein
VAQDEDFEILGSIVTGQQHKELDRTAQRQVCEL